MEKNHFFAMHSRMKYINRWSLMRNTQSENISEHSNDVAAIAHAIARATGVWHRELPITPEKVAMSVAVQK